MSQLDALIEAKGLTAEFDYGNAKGVGWDGAPHNWRVTLSYQDREMSCDFFGGELVTNPTAADVVSSLLLDAHAGEMTFEEFASDFGYDTDSRKAYAVWKATRLLSPKIRHLLGTDFDEFAQAEH